MHLIRTLLAKDLRRVRRNPIPIITQIGIALILVAVIGLAFGEQAKSGSGMAPIKMAIVDEDESFFTELLQNSISSKKFAEYFDTEFLDRAEAMERVDANEISAVAVIPDGFSDAFLDGSESGRNLELIKNPAQSIYTAIVEEGLEALLTLLNALSRNFGEELRNWRDILEEAEEADFFSTVFLASKLLGDAREQIESARDYLTPPLVSFESSTRSDGTEEEAGKPFDLFSYLFAGMAGMFLLMIANSSTNGIYRESQFGTLRRFSSMHGRLLPFVLGKMVLVVAVTSISAVIMFVGGALLFGIEWISPGKVAIVTLAYCVCGAGLTSLIASIAGKEKRADTPNTIIIMGLALLSGTMVQTDALPGFIQDYVSPYLPTEWFIRTVRDLQNFDMATEWVGISIRLCIFGFLFAGVSATLFHRKILKGGAV